MVGTSGPTEVIGARRLIETKMMLKKSSRLNGFLVEYVNVIVPFVSFAVLRRVSKF